MTPRHVATECRGREVMVASIGYDDANVLHSLALQNSPFLMAIADTNVSIDPDAVDLAVPT